MSRNVVVTILHWMTGIGAIAALVLLTIWSNGGVFALGEFLNKHPMHWPLVVAPPLVFGLTMFAYFKYIVDYKGTVAGISLVAAIAALVICLRLVLCKPWWEHLIWLYSLFYSYVIWDILMVDIFIRWEGKDKEEVAIKSEISEIKIVSAMINVPTLITVGCVFAAAQWLSKQVADPAALDEFAAGVVSFHLMFACFAYISLTGRITRNYRLTLEAK